MNYGMRLMDIEVRVRDQLRFNSQMEMELKRRGFCSPQSFFLVKEGSHKGITVVGPYGRQYNVPWEKHTIKERRKGNGNTIPHEFVVDGIHTRAGEDLDAVLPLFRQDGLDRLLKPYVFHRLRQIVGGDCSAAHAAAVLIATHGGSHTNVTVSEIEKLLHISASAQPAELFANRERLWNEYMLQRDRLMRMKRTGMRLVSIPHPTSQ